MTHPTQARTGPAPGSMLDQRLRRGRETGAETTRILESPLGPLVAAATPAGIRRLEFLDREGASATARGPAAPGRSPHLERLQAELAAYFEGRLTRFSVPLLLEGTPFQRRVWRSLTKIPYGRSASYEELARAAGSPAACRAAGSANGRNRIVILVPCHRVVNKNGKLGGYGGGLWRKRALLDLERRAAAR